jgi:hypothetical protein
MSNINILLNYYIENDHLNLNNNITYDNLILLLDSCKKYNIVINKINIPEDFKYKDILLESFKNGYLSN